MRDYLAYGIENEAIRHQLFAVKSVTYTTAYQLAVSLEDAELNAGLKEEAMDINHIIMRRQIPERTTCSSGAGSAVTRRSAQNVKIAQNQRKKCQYC